MGMEGSPKTWGIPESGYAESPLSPTYPATRTACMSSCAHRGIPQGKVQGWREQWRRAPLTFPTQALDVKQEIGASENCRGFLEACES